jgi:hypothetical protein
MQPMATAEPAPPRQLWLYCAQNLWVDKVVDELEVLWRRAAAAGYTHVLVSDSKSAKLGDMDARYFRNVDRLRKLAAELKLEIVPALFPIGYSNDILWHDPNLIEGLPVRDALFVVQGGTARLASDPQVELKGDDFSELKAWDWKDDLVKSDGGAALIRDPKGRNARMVQKLHLTPFRQYHLSVRVKTREFRGTPELKILAGNQALNFNPLGVKSTQDWTTHHVVFNTLEHAEPSLYLGCWGGETGELWFDDLTLTEVGLLNVIRRPGAPLVVRIEGGGALREDRDFEPVRDPLMGNKPWNGAYDVWHEPPAIRTRLPDGTRLRVSYYHVTTVYDDQAMICPSEPRTVELLKDQAQRMHAAWQAKGYMMSHDEIRVLNWCDACQRRKLDAGAILADNVRTCIGILRTVNPGGTVYVWSDMFDPNHNAHGDYYLVRGDLKNSWEGLDSEVVVLPWYFEKRDASLKWFAERGHRQVIAGYYDGAPDRIREWVAAARPFPRIEGVMYTTWQRKFGDLETFARLVLSQPGNP